MPYYEDLEQLTEETCLWADLRREQGADIAGVIKRLRVELRRARGALRRAEPGERVRRNEPNVLAQIKALRPKGPRRLWPRLRTTGLRDRMKGAWLGRAAGCTLGAPVEGWAIDAMEGLARRYRAPFPPTDYWPAHPWPESVRYGVSACREYLKSEIRFVPVDDDLTYTVLGLLILEAFGPDFTTDDVAQAWLAYLPMACTGEAITLDNLRAGALVATAGETNNPCQEWIGADIRSDPWGYAAPGWPERAAEMAYRDAVLSARRTGIYGTMFFAAAAAAAFACDGPVEALEIALSEIPRGCRFARDIRWALDVGPKLRDWRAARDAVDKRFKGMHPVHTSNNACLTVFGLMLGQGDFTRTIGLTVAMGLDNDCTAATAGSILGAVVGARNIPDHWWKPFRNRTRTYLHGHEWFRNTDIVNRFLAAARNVWGQ